MSTDTTTQTDLERFDPREVIAAAPDFLAQAFGTKPPGRTQHPLASSIDLPIICGAFARVNASPGNSPAAGGFRNSNAAIRGATSGAFVKLLSDAASPVL